MVDGGLRDSLGVSALRSGWDRAWKGRDGKGKEGRGRGEERGREERKGDMGAQVQFGNGVEGGREGRE